MAQRRFYVVMFWAKNFQTISAKTAEISAALARVGEWLRFNPYTYLMWTDKTSAELYEAVRASITQEEQLLISAVDLLNDRYGWSQQWIWDWIDQRRV